MTQRNFSLEALTEKIDLHCSDVKLISISIITRIGEERVYLRSSTFDVFLIKKTLVSEKKSSTCIE
jgi:hypothetical protein